MRKHLYRFISFEDFINLVINNKDKFVRPSVWDDGYEGYLFSSLDSPEDVRHIVSEMYYNLCPRNYYAIPDNYFRMWHSKCFTYAQCWSEHRETDAMWRCYSYGNRAIRIRSRADKLLAHVKSIFQENSGFTVYLRKVSYDLNKRSNIEQQIAQMGDSKLTHETYFHKRPAFKHEKEVRLLIADTSLYIRENLSSLGVKWNIAEQVMGKNDEEIIEMLKDRKAIVLYNKTDLASAVSMEALKEKINHPLIPISAKEETGIAQLADTIKSMFFSGKISFNDEVYITNARHKEALEEAEESLAMVKQSIEDGMPEDFFSIDLMAAYGSLGKITGEEVGEDLVNEIFSKFCMGK